jgi:hypothetical protein
MAQAIQRPYLWNSESIRRGPPTEAALLPGCQASVFDFMSNGVGLFDA